jgi:hypothetical protein
MIIGIQGGLGSGKTILMTRYLYKDWKKAKEIFASYGLKEIKFTPIDMSKILEMHANEFNMRDCTIGIDEITVFADCRRSGSKMNRLISYFILQSRKRNVDIYFTTQNLAMIDFRLIDYMDFQIECKKVKDTKGHEVEGYAQYTVFDLRDMQDIKVKQFMLDIRPYYRYYDTNEVVLPLA